MDLPFCSRSAALEACLRMTRAPAMKPTRRAMRWVIMLGKFREKGGDLSLEFGDAFRVGLFDDDRDIHLLDAGEHLFVVGRRVDY